jgi:hypothetical protein
MQRQSTYRDIAALKKIENISRKSAKTHPAPESTEAETIAQT